jgi:hypothetical protein
MLQLKFVRKSGNGQIFRFGIVSRRRNERSTITGTRRKGWRRGFVLAVVVIGATSIGAAPAEKSGSARDE